ncbi:energy-coupled thiamine transporter ThiT [Clostridium estertheticum]|uniref:energy-coupled thiamine transporter ThiT n=1 Tax=Clostridium estertheticum TaxID=238834 RepID=UPI001CF57B36|nr:energy-coupled thiamine transporter ThiT [Clostridium estertheticum]MCB2305436.1 energy-coupled thiamine transporter ThiT [Clostridium estertheticum]MCB2343875.1 energy-coupled thiamine transporter ThiT [Clostridium estertheticum]MCB2348792.1 energy-coupled thiamine transporter ThiT [Clostridium estertheticum]WAG46112.1 energy-coupled thiamine transporter ThiT [Clostridium estertheticum]
MSLNERITEITKSPIALFALLGVLILIYVILKVRKIKFTTQMITLVGVSIALATSLQFITIMKLPQGGSVTAGSMVPIVLIALFYGPEVGFLTGFLFGIINFILSPFAVHPVQVLFDYPLPFMAIGIVGYFRSLKITGILIGVICAMLARFACHFISGVVFFATSAPKGTSVYLYSLLYNGSYMGLEAIITCIIIAILPIKRLSKLVVNKPSLS